MAEEGNDIGREIQETHNHIEVSPYIKEIMARPAIKQRLEELLENGEANLAKGEFETSFKHSVDVAKLAESCIDEGELEASPAESKEIFITAALLHDIGKDKVPLEVLAKRGKLTEEERRNIERHTLEGWLACQDIADELKDASKSESRKMAGIIAEIVFRHHAYGKGETYPPTEAFHINPDDETEKMIKEMAKKLSILDIFEALRSFRSYRTPAGKIKVSSILRGKFPDNSELIDFLTSNFIEEE